MKGSWKGSLTFGLVTIDVELYAAIKKHALGFKLLHAACHQPLEYERWCPYCKKEVVWEDVEKGIKMEDGTYFVITPENLKKLRPERTDTIEIVEFVKEAVINPILYEDHYYVLPSRSPYNAFFLLTKALEKLDMIAIGKMVMRDKDYVVAIRPYGNILLLTTLNYAYEIRHIEKMDQLKIPKLPTQELKLAEQYIKKLFKQHFKIENYKDRFAQELKKRIKGAQKGKKLLKVRARAAVSKKPKKVSLMKTLEESLKKIEKSAHA